MACCGRRNERIVRCAASDPVIGQLQDEFTVGRDAETEERLSKA